MYSSNVNKKGFCRRGHEKTGDNLVVVDGKNICRECRNMRARNQYWGVPTNPPTIINNKRRCTCCQEEKDLGEFYSKGGGRNGGRKRIEAICKECKYKKDRSRLDKISVKVHRAYVQKRLRQSDPEGTAAKAKAHREKLRNEVINAYGGFCACCGESNREFLAIDHIKGGGNKARQEGIHIAGTAFYLWLRKMNFPKDIFRLLCHNCNMARGCYGYCPHEKQVNMLIESASRQEGQLLSHGETK